MRSTRRSTDAEDLAGERRRMVLGDSAITALKNGTVDLAVTPLLTNTTVARLRAALERACGRYQLSGSMR